MSFKTLLRWPHWLFSSWREEVVSPHNHTANVALTCKTAGCRWPWILCIIRKGNPQVEILKTIKIMSLQLIACRPSNHQLSCKEHLGGWSLFVLSVGEEGEHLPGGPLLLYQLLSAASRENQATAWGCATWECDENRDWVDRTHVLLVFYVCSLNGFRIAMHFICRNICTLHKSIRATCEKENLEFWLLSQNSTFYL